MPSKVFNITSVRRNPRQHWEGRKRKRMLVMMVTRDRITLSCLSQSLPWELWSVDTDFLDNNMLPLMTRSPCLLCLNIIQSPDTRLRNKFNSHQFDVNFKQILSTWNICFFSAEKDNTMFRSLKAFCRALREFIKILWMKIVVWLWRVWILIEQTMLWARPAQSSYVQPGPADKECCVWYQRWDWHELIISYCDLLRQFLHA